MNANHPIMVVGLGNPGSRYVGTRHNVGFVVVDLMAEALGWPFKEDKKLSAAIARGKVGEQSLYLVKPLTYMNLSGQAVGLCLNYFKLSPSDLLVVCDDVAIPLGEMRLRVQGSAGGHNGLKDIERHLGTQEYARLRLGVGDRSHGELADHVLGRFTSEERPLLTPLLTQACQVVKRLWTEPLELVMNEVNRRPRPVKVREQANENQSTPEKGLGET